MVLTGFYHHSNSGFLPEFVFLIFSLVLPCRTGVKYL